MELRDPFPVDLADPDDVRAKYEVAREQQAQAEELAEKWRARAEALAGAAGIRVRPEDEERMFGLMHAGRITKVSHYPDGHLRSVEAAQDQRHVMPTAILDMGWPGSAQGRGEPEIGDLVVEVVTSENRQMKAKEVHDLLLQRGYKFATNQVSNALHYAANRANPARLAKGSTRGMYAPIGWDDDEIDVTTRPIAGALKEAAARLREERIQELEASRIGPTPQDFRDQRGPSSEQTGL